MSRNPNSECHLCGKQIYTRPGSFAKNKFSFCSFKCRSAFWNRSGPESPHWKGGRYINSKGYVLIYKPEHPYANKKGYVFEHRLVAEETLGRFLKPGEQVHHDPNKPKWDNTPENLKVFGCSAEHNVYEAQEVFADRYSIIKCDLCGKEFERLKTHLRSDKNFCSPECQHKAIKPPVKKPTGALKIYVCSVCGKTFETYQCNVRSDTPCCSKECAAKQKSVGKWVDMNCPICGNSYQRLRSELKKDSACSIECRHKLRSKGTVSLKCAKCGVQFSRLARKVPDWDNGKPYYCSKSCSSQANAEKHRSA